jgi:hypothetical protein
MVKIILISKFGIVTEKNVQGVTDDTTLYKKCGFQNNKNFGLRHLYKSPNKNIFYGLYAKDVGKSSFENKYELPPPIDKELFFNTMCVIKVYKSEEENKILDVTKEDWEKEYEYLFGGFENLDQTSDESEEDELDNVPDEMKTKEGYLKDGFIIDGISEDDSEDGEDSYGSYSDNDSDSDNYNSELSEEEYTDDEDDDV